MFYQSRLFNCCAVSQQSASQLSSQCNDSRWGVRVAPRGLMFPIAGALFEAQQLNKRQNGPWKQMRSDDCTTAWTDWLNDFFFISSGSSTAAQLPSPLVWVLASPRFQSLRPPSGPLTHPLPPSLSTTSLPTTTFLSLWDPMHHFFCLNYSTSFFFFTSLFSGRYSALLCVSNSDCLQISRILISTGNCCTTISVVETDYVCCQNSLRLFSHTCVERDCRLKRLRDFHQLNWNWMRP